MTSQSSLSSSEEWFDADHVEYRFTAILKCSRDECSEVVAIAGRGNIESIPDERMEQMDHEERFFATYMRPSPWLISIPERCPLPVRENLCAAFILSWGDYDSAANRIRVAAECLLDALRIPKTLSTKTGARRVMTLHKRIEALPARRAGVRDALLAIKWLGNHGSHQTDLSQDAVYDALDIFESVLNAIYSDYPDRIKRLVAEVNRRRGPARTRALFGARS